MIETVWIPIHWLLLGEVLLHSVVCVWISFVIEGERILEVSLNLIEVSLLGLAFGLHHLVESILDLGESLQLFVTLSYHSINAHFYLVLHLYYVVEGVQARVVLLAVVWCSLVGIWDLTQDVGVIARNLDMEPFVEVLQLVLLVKVKHCLSTLGALVQDSLQG